KAALQRPAEHDRGLSASGPRRRRTQTNGPSWRATNANVPCAFWKAEVRQRTGPTVTWLTVELALRFEVETRTARHRFQPSHARVRARRSKRSQNIVSPARWRFQGCDSLAHNWRTPP